MKPVQVLLILVAFLILSFTADKYIVVKFKEEQINYHWQNLSTIKQIVNGSSLPHNQALFILQSVDSLQKDIQSTAVIDSTTSKK
jgi:hypothetical protein